MGATRASSIRTSAAVAALLALGLTGCTTAAEPPSVEEEIPERLVVSTVGELTSFNATTQHGATPANATVAEYLNETFAFLGDDLQVRVNEGFGKVELVSEDPLKVVYTLNGGRAWSDGQPVTLDDLVFGWAVSSGYFDDAVYDEQGALVSGTRYFETAPPAARFHDTGVPEVDPVKRTVTVEYDESFADWNRQWLLNGSVHAVAQRAGVSVEEIMTAIRTQPKGDPAAPAAANPVLQAAAAAWNTGFDVDPAAPDLSAAVSNGPYTAAAWTADSLTLVRNEHYEGQHFPGFDEVEVRFYDTVEEQLAAVASGEVDVANVEAPEAEQIEALEEEGEVTTLPAPRSQALSLAFTGTEEWIDPNLRDALFSAVDREALVDELQGEVYRDARVLQSFLTSPAAGPLYSDIASGNDSSSYPGPDQQRAEDLLEGRTPELRVWWDATDPLQDAVMTQVRRMSASVGISVVPAETAEAADAVLVATDATRSLLVTAEERIDAGLGGTDAVAAYAELRESSDPERAVEYAREIDRAIIAEGDGLPLLASWGVVVHSDAVDGVEATGWSWGMPREFWTWTPA